MTFIRDKRVSPDSSRQSPLGDGKRNLHLKVFQVLPRGMSFSPDHATSIDLCTHDLVRASRFADATRIIAEPVDRPFADLKIDYFSEHGGSSTVSRAKFVAQLARRTQPDVIVVQAHLPTASAIARRCPGIPIVLHSHGFQRSDYNRRTIGGYLHRSFKLQRYRRLAGMIHVSEACAQNFAAAWPDIIVPQTVVYNAFDFSEWQPAERRDQEILCVGRCVEEKGILEGAEAVAAILPKFPAWRARFILSNVHVEPHYFALVTAALAPLGEQITVEVEQPFQKVQLACERAAIAIVPSKWAEPFGRTALEAHAGGAALISSGTGGLREASGDNAIFLSSVSTSEIATALKTLIESPELRSRLARGGYIRASKQFSLHQQANTLDAFISKLAANVA